MIRYYFNLAFINPMSIPVTQSKVITSVLASLDVGAFSPADNTKL